MVIQIYGEVTDESFSRFSRRLRRLEEEGLEELTVEIISEGGSATAALAYFDRITNSSIVITGIATGLVASAASLIFMACDKRLMTDNAWLMVHEDTLGELENKKVHELEKEVQHSRRLENQWCNLMASVTFVSKDEWAKLHKAETYLSKQECYDLGLLEGK